MWAMDNMRSRRLALLAGGTALALAAAGCGGEDFANAPRPPIAVQLDGVIREDGVAVSPTREGAGPIRLTIANLTDRAQTVTLEGDDVIERVGPVQPMDTATIRKTLDSGTYEVRAGTSRAVDIEDQIPPATITIGPPRRGSDSELLLP
jgi:hypothetical protein